MRRVRYFLRSLGNWRRGFAFGYVRRCRRCRHTAYRPDDCPKCDPRARPSVSPAAQEDA